MAVVALAARMIAAAGDTSIMNDGPRFLAGAEAWLRLDLGAIVRDDFHPGTGALIALVSALTGAAPESAGRAVSVVVGALASLALYALVRDALSRRVALAAGLLHAVHPPSLLAASSVQSDALHQMLFVSAAFAGWRALRSGSALAAAAAGALTGLAYLVRPEGLLVAIVMGAWLAAALATAQLQRRRVVLAGAAFAIALAAATAPYIGAIRWQTGEWRLTQKKSVAAMIAPDITRAEPQPTEAAPPPRITRAVGEVARDGLRAVHPVFFALCLLGLPRRRPRRAELYLLSYPVALGGVLLLLHLSYGYVSRRHWLVGAALLLPFAAQGLLAIAEALQRLWPRLAPRAGAVRAALLGAGVAAGLFYALGDRDEPVKLARVEAALWLRERAPATVVATHRSRIAWYAAASRFVQLRADLDPRQALEAARAAGAAYAIAEESRLFPAGTPELAGATLLHEVPYGGGRVLVLALDPPDVAAAPATPAPP